MPGKMKLQYENDSCFHIEKASGGVRGLMKGVADGGYGWVPVGGNLARDRYYRGCAGFVR